MEKDGKTLCGDILAEIERREARSYNFKMVTATYSRGDYGDFYRDDCGGITLRPGAKPVSYRVDNRDFGSPEEVVFYLSVTDPEAGVMLNMNDAAAREFQKAWTARAVS